MNEYDDAFTKYGYSDEEIEELAFRCYCHFSGAIGNGVDLPHEPTIEEVEEYLRVRNFMHYEVIAPTIYTEIVYGEYAGRLPKIEQDTVNNLWDTFWKDIISPLLTISWICLLIFILLVFLPESSENAMVYRNSLSCAFGITALLTDFSAAFIYYRTKDKE